MIPPEGLAPFPECLSQRWHKSSRHYLLAHLLIPDCFEKIRVRVLGQAIQTQHAEHDTPPCNDSVILETDVNDFLLNTCVKLCTVRDMMCI